MVSTQDSVQSFSHAQFLNLIFHDSGRPLCRSRAIPSSNFSSEEKQCDQTPCWGQCFSTVAILSYTRTLSGNHYPEERSLIGYSGRVLQRSSSSRSHSAHILPGLKVRGPLDTIAHAGVSLPAHINATATQPHVGESYLGHHSW